MRDRGGPIFWFIAGAATGFSALDLIGLGAITLLPAIGIAALLLALRVPGWPMSLVGAGSLIAILWTLHITSGNTPDSELWPILVGVVLVAAGGMISMKQKRARLLNA